MLLFDFGYGTCVIIVQVYEYTFTTCPGEHGVCVSMAAHACLPAQTVQSSRRKTAVRQPRAAKLNRKQQQ